MVTLNSFTRDKNILKSTENQENTLYTVKSGVTEQTSTLKKYKQTGIFPCYIKHRSTKWGENNPALYPEQEHAACTLNILKEKYL